MTFTFLFIVFHFFLCVFTKLQAAYVCRDEERE